MRVPPEVDALAGMDEVPEVRGRLSVGLPPKFKDPEVGRRMPPDWNDFERLGAMDEDLGVLGRLTIGLLPKFSDREGDWNRNAGPEKDEEDLDGADLMLWACDARLGEDRAVFIDCALGVRCEDECPAECDLPLDRGAPATSVCHSSNTRGTKRATTTNPTRDHDD
jgi:hypothetical protein